VYCKISVFPKSFVNFLSLTNVMFGWFLNGPTLLYGVITQVLSFLCFVSVTRRHINLALNYVFIRIVIKHPHSAIVWFHGFWIKNYLFLHPDPLFLRVTFCWQELEALKDAARVLGLKVKHFIVIICEILPTDKFHVSFHLKRLWIRGSELHVLQKFAKSFIFVTIVCIICNYCKGLKMQL
jgi:hypothetical protein